MVKILICITFILKNNNRPSGGVCFAHLPEGTSPRGKSSKELPCSHKAEPNTVEPVARIDKVTIGGTHVLRKAVPTTATNNASELGRDIQRINTARQFITVFYPAPILSHFRACQRDRKD